MTAIQRVNWIIIQIWTCDRILKSWRKYISHVDLWPAIAMAVWEKVETERYLCIRIAKDRKSQLDGKCHAITQDKETGRDTGNKGKEDLRKNIDRKNQSHTTIWRKWKQLKTVI